ncbi:MAG: hypothetical protein JWO91_3066 [Acidobacteriaceae bacterium]|nr:hypothetical protein [Acidobacteriaceae bacterium]
MKLVLGSGKLNAIWVTVLAIAISTSPMHAQQATISASPGELVRKTVQNELNASEGHAKYMFRDQKKTAQGSQTKLMVETDDSMAGILVEQNGHPLTPDQQRAEDARLEGYIKNPAELNKKRQKERDEADHTKKIVAAMPDALLYENDGTVPGTQSLGRPGDVLLRLKFRPNPNYNPPTHVEQILTGMTGYMLIDTNQCRIAKIDGTLVKDVAFGWGILGHLDPGGHFLVQQADVGGGHWEATRMDLAFDGKVMLFKKLHINSSQIFTDYHPTPSNLSFEQGVVLLKKKESELAQNPRQVAENEKQE